MSSVRSARRKRIVSIAAVLALGIALGVGFAAMPASGHVGGSITHLVSHLKQYFFTNSQSDSRYVRKVNTSWHEVGAPGEPAFGDCNPSITVSNHNIFDNNTVGFFKDLNRIVHLKGVATVDGNVSSNCSTIFFLPPGFRPAHTELQLALKNGQPFQLTILADGRIFAGDGVWLAGEWISIDGMSFRAAP